ncbi:MAG: putative toxin-antitoxin system antitoxin component (TIGR02293 family) [Flavobacteriaceae bacterium]|jgi:putative toxin-antitoxin system antitoxin component (TIGR02293 family)
MTQYSGTSTEHYDKLVGILGKRYVKSKVESPFDFIHIASNGINANVIKNFRRYFNLSLEATADMLNISEPTIYRWTRANKSLERNFSVRLFEITDLFLYGSDVFGDKENFFKWLNLPNTSLGGMEPQELVDIPGGVSKVKDVLGRIEYGVYS